MKFVIAPDKYKGSLTGSQFCEAVEKGIQRVFPQAQILKKPLADGGDGTLEVVQDYLKASLETIKVKDPLFRDIEAGYLLSQDKKTAYIEMSEASGYKLLRKDEMNCMHTSTLGTGQLLLDAVHKGAQHIVLGIGGSATNDCGMGMASAFGYAFLDADGNRLQPVGKNLVHAKKIVDDETSGLLKKIQVKVACDVNNPLYGENGAAHVYAAQKGASPEEIDILDQGLENFANVLQSHFGNDVRDVPGAGAAGGMGAGAMTFLNAKLVSGVDLVLEMADFDLALMDADWVITGEGQLDNQTAAGKTIAGVVKMAKARQIPVAALCGSVNASIEQIQEMGLDYAVSVLNQVGSLEDAKANSFSNLEQASFNFAKLLEVG
ncbi:glycerate kinase [Flagellimonas flava]|uniref:glycerate kinase n=1 Tax=Flagellimonas flava TaxID=570519 RepID=UPI003D66241B